MVSFNEVQAQLISLNNHFRFIGIAELKQLSIALQPGEQIMDCLKGWHNGTVSVLCATDQRLIFVDKTTTKNSVREISYDLVEKLHHIDRGWSSVLRLYVPGSMFEFVSWHIKRLKHLHLFIDRHVSYMKEQAESAQELVDKIRFQTSIRPAETSRNWAVFAKRIGNSSLS